MGFAYHISGESQASFFRHPECQVLVEEEVFIQQGGRFEDDYVLGRNAGEEKVIDLGEELGGLLNGPRGAIPRRSTVVGEDVDDDDVVTAVIVFRDSCKCVL